MNDKARSPWFAGILTFFVIGLGHLYSGQAKKGIILYFVGQGIFLAIFLPLLYFYTTGAMIFAAVLGGIAFLIYCIFDAVKVSKQKIYGYALKSYNRWYVYLGCLVLATFVIQPVVSSSIKMFLFQAYKIPAGSLKPTLRVGDHILAKKLLAVKQGINRGDMIIFPFPKDTSKDFIKRVVAIGGETIEIVNKKVFINGELIEEPYIVHSDPNIIPKGQQPRDNYGPSMIPEDLLFVMGDNRDQSYDSRFWGFVKKSDVTGKARSIYWSWDKENFKVRWNRIGKKID